MAVLAHCKVKATEEADQEQEPKNETVDHWLYSAMVAADPPHAIASLAV